MKRAAVLAVLGTLSVLSVSVTGCRARQPHPSAAGSPAAKPFPGRQFEHVLIIVLENEDNATVVADPYMKSLSQRGRRFASYNGLFHPSYPNYLALVAGNSFHTYGDLQKNIDAPTIADLLEAHHLTWTQYAESYPGGPGSCFVQARSRDGLYYRKHVPFLSFIPIQRTGRCANVVPATQFDRHHLPSYAFYTPNMKNDGHNTGLAYAVRWLRGFLEPILADDGVMKDTLVVVTFDESASQRGNHIYTVFLGDMVKQGVDESPYNHYNLLRTVEENFGVGTLGAQDAAVAPIVDAWKGAKALLLGSGGR